VIADGLGRAVAFILAPGQAHERPHAVPLLERLPGVPKWVVADRGLSSHAFREHIWTLGARPAIPSKRNEEEVAGPEWIDANRNHVERLWSRLKEWRAIATRYEKTASSFMPLHGRPLPCRHSRRAQAITGPKQQFADCPTDGHGALR
jgi:transposase